MEEETAKSPGSRKERTKDRRKVSEAEGKRWR